MPRRSTRVEKTCKNCGQVFKAKRSAPQQYCSKSCMKDFEAVHGRTASQVAPLEFSCKQCGKPFFMKPAYVAEYRKKFGRDPLYCSIPCSALGRKADTEARNTFVCRQCGRTRQMKRYAAKGRSRYARTQRFCDQVCKSEYQRSSFHQRFADGQHTRRIKRGYVMIRIPTEAGEPRREMLEHRYVMEQHLGRELLPTETVHHKRQWDKTDNSLDNLELWSSNHGPGGRVTDIIAWCIEMMQTYPEFTAAAGYMLVPYTEAAEVTPQAMAALANWTGHLQKRE